MTGAIMTAVGWLVDRPWLVAPVAAVSGGVLVARVLVGRWRHRRLRQRSQLVTITPPPEVAPDGASTWWATLGELLQPSRRRRWWYGVPHVGFEYRWTGRQLTIQVWLPGTVPAAPVAAAARAAWPGAATTVAPAGAPLPVDALAEGGALVAALPAWYPLRTEHDCDPLRTLLSEMAGLADHEHACVQIRPATPRQVRRLRRGTGMLRTGTTATRLSDPTGWVRGLLNLLLPGPAAGHGHASASRATAADPQRDRDARAAVDKLTDGHLWQAAIGYAIAHTNPRNSSAGQDPTPAAYPGARHRLRIRHLHRPAAAAPAPASPPGPGAGLPGAARRVAAGHHRTGHPGRTATRPGRTRAGPRPRPTHARPGRDPRRRPRAQGPRPVPPRRPLRRPARGRRPPTSARDRAPPA
jgi:hypothetical protein